MGHCCQKVFKVEINTFRCECVIASVFTVASWGVESPNVLSELKRPAVIPPEKNMAIDKREIPALPRKTKETETRGRNHTIISPSTMAKLL